MEAQNFFGFDASGPDDESGEGIIDEEYDALNDETFGAAVGGDWERDHEQMATITEAGRSQRHRNHQQMRDGLAFEEVAAGLSRLGQSSSPMNIMGGYQHHPNAGGGHPGGHMGGILGGPDIAGSPSSIWAPSPGLDKLISPVNHESSIVGSPGSLNHIGGMGQMNHVGLGNLGLPSIKTVAELEDEMKLQQHRHNASTTMPPTINQQQQQQQHQLNQQQQQQQHNQQQLQQQQQQFGLHRQGSFNGIPNNRNNQFNTRHQRPFGNQGAYLGPTQGTQHQHGSGGPPHHHINNHHPQQQQRFINNFPNNKGPFNHHNQFHLPPGGGPGGPLHHMNNHHHHHGSNHDGFNNYNNQHHNYHHNLQQQQQQQQQHPMHPNNRNGDGRYFSHNGYDVGRNGNGFDRRNFDRRSFDQNGRFEQGKSHFDQREYGNGRDHNHLNNSVNINRDSSSSGGGGGRVRRDSEAEWEEWQRLRDQDEYCGLMTPREKSWLKNIQAMQLHSDSPYQDDYYYVMYSVKQQRKREEEVIEIDGLQLLIPDRGKDGGREYEPPRLENSLGKLQVVSVNAPRKIVDLQVVHLDPKHPTSALQREMRKHRHLLLHIEKMYTTMMEIDDLERKIRLLPDCPTRDLYKTKSKHLASGLWFVAIEAPDRLVQLLSVKKGKSLLSRLMRWLGENECEQLVVCVCQNLSVVAKRDTHDQYLVNFWPAADRLLSTSNSQRLMLLAQALLLTPHQGHKSNLQHALNNKFGMSLVVGLLVRGEELHSELEKQTLWQEFLASTIMALTDTQKSLDSAKSDLAVPLPSITVAASPQKPWQHLGRCGRIEAGSLKVAQEKLSSLEVSRAKAAAASAAAASTTSPSPVKNLDTQ